MSRYLKSRYDRLVTLIHSSLHVIRILGLNFFLKTVYSELRENKLSVFSPTFRTSYITKISPQASYNQWLEIHKITLATEQKFRDSLQVLNKLKIAVVISVDVYNKEFLSKTLDSVLSQIYENWTIYFDCDEPSVREIHELKVDFKDDRINFKEFRLQDLDSENLDYCVFVNQGSILTKDALYQIIIHLNEKPETDIIYSDEDSIHQDKRIEPFFKPDWSTRLFLSMDYISNFYAVRVKLLQKNSFEENKYKNVKHYDLLLRLGESTNRIDHIPMVLVSVKDQRSNETNEYIKSAIIVLTETLKRRNIDGHVTKSQNNARGWPIFRIKYKTEIKPKVSIIIPTKDNVSLLKRCLDAIEKKTAYQNYEIIIIDNNSVKQETISYLKSLPYTVIQYPYQFNFSKMNNFAVTKSLGEYLLFLNDDTAPLEQNWLTDMIEIGSQEDIGAVGAKLIHSDNTIQHAGIILLKTGAGFHPWQHVEAYAPVNFGFLNLTRNCTAVTGACLLVRKKIFEEIGGYDDLFDLYYGDTDLCMRIIDRGYEVVYTPYAILLHQGSSTIKEHTSAFFTVENHHHFIKKFPRIRNGDPYYNPNYGWDYDIDLNVDIQ